MLRLKQAKFGHSLLDIVPDHQNNFYLPDKGNYLPKERKNISGSAASHYNSSKSNLGNSNKIQILRANTNMSKAA